MPASLSERLIAATFRVINRWKVWYRLPFPLAVGNLVGLRVDLRWKNLFDTETAPAELTSPADFDIRTCRTADGSFNDLAKPWMGAVNTRFARNAPLPQTFGETPPGLYEPNPRVISRDLLARDKFIPAETVNLLLAAWLQFMVHDWLSHGVNDKTSPPMRIPVPPGDDWPKPEITVLRTCPDGQRGPADDGRPPPSATPPPNGGTGRRCTAPISRCSAACAAGPSGCCRTASSISTPPGICRLILTRATAIPSRNTPPSTATGGSASRPCTRCSRASTTRSS